MINIKPPKFHLIFQNKISLNKDCKGKNKLKKLGLIRRLQSDLIEDDRA